MKKKIDHLRRNRIIDSGPMTRLEYARYPERFELKFSNGFNKSYQLGKNYLEEKFIIKTESYG